MTYRIKEVDGEWEEHILRQLHDATFAEDAPFPSQEAHWWLVFASGTKEPVAFAAMHQGRSMPEYGYLLRAGVIPEHRGKGLQRRLIRVREKKARTMGLIGMTSDTYDSPQSANNLIATGYRLFTPAHPWSFSYAQYWKKDF